jgi:hypothetical protein
MTPSVSYTRVAIDAYCGMTKLEPLMAFSFKVEGERVEQIFRSLRDRELDVLKKGIHHPWSPWIYGAAAAAAVASLCFTRSVSGCVATSLSLVSAAHATTGLVSDHRIASSQATLKQLRADRFLVQNTFGEEAASLIGMEQAMRDAATAMTRMIEITTHI